MSALSIRGSDFARFAEMVIEHIENYTVPQYGDSPDDNVALWSSEDCLKQVEKYLKRVNSNQRPGEEFRDLLKMAHYIQLAYLKKEKNR